MKLHLLIFLLAIGICAKAQENGSPNPEEDIFIISSPLTLDLEVEEEVKIVELKKKKRKKNVFYGIKTKKGFTRKGFGEKQVIELFYLPKVLADPDPYVRDLYWYDYKSKEIKNGSNFDSKRGVLLHGPYTRIQGESMLDSGVFYKGAKHGTWMYYDKDFILVNKEKYYKGWPRQSSARYYDRERKKLKEVIPIKFGEKDGKYFHFYKDGRLAVKGQYRWNEKIGDWVEYYPSGRRKRILRYSTDPFDDIYKPYIWKEWSKQGREIYNADIARRRY